MEHSLPKQITVFERGWLSSNNILLKGLHETALVDSGYVSHADQTVAMVRSALGNTPLLHLLNTHLHSDHCGGNAALQAQFPALQTHVPPGEAEAAARWDENALSYAATGQECPRYSIDALLNPGDQIRLGDFEGEIHAAPGHDPHSILLFEPASRVLISADALWEKGFGVVFPELEGEASFDQVASILNLIESLVPRVVIPGHGRTFSTVDEALVAARNRLDLFSRVPEKHARHALKVLLKFKLLESRRLSFSELQSWVERTPYFESIRRRFFPSYALQPLSKEVVEALTRSGAAEICNGFVMDR